MEIRKICAWCKKDLGSIPTVGYQPQNAISHGICPDCLRNFFDFGSQSMEEFLERFEHPVFLVDSNGRTIYANKKSLSLLDKSLQEVTGQLSGDVFECIHAIEGCGQTVHCKSCTIRNTVNKTFKTGESCLNVPAYPDLHHITKENKVRYLISTKKQGNAVILSINDISEEKK